MAKTVFSSGVIVTSQFLNGAQQIHFDGQDADWHYPPLGIDSLVTSGSSGLDSRYITLGTDQPTLNSGGVLLSGAPISGTKVVTGLWNFGYAPITGNPVNTISHAPKSYTTVDKYNYANGIPSPSPAQKYAALSDEDLLTKIILTEQISNIYDNLVVDNGVYYSETTPGCNNYSAPGGSSVICQN